jgi:hypothetical protein
VASLPPNPAATLSGRKAPQLCFPKRPLRTRLELSCLAASQPSVRADLICGRDRRLQAARDTDGEGLIAELVRVEKEVSTERYPIRDRIV